MKEEIEVFQLLDKGMYEELFDGTNYRLVGKNFINKFEIVGKKAEFAIEEHKYIYLLNQKPDLNGYSYFYILNRNNYFKYKEGKQNEAIIEGTYSAKFTRCQLIQIKRGMGTMWYQDKMFIPLVITSLIGLAAIIAPFFK